jgi:L-ascorbate metabolism protein UlaG (beta-lactamase superfamily)
MTPALLGHSTFRIEAATAKIVIDTWLSDKPSWRVSE